MSSGIKTLRKILYVAMHFDYGRKDWGTGFEFNNFYGTLQRMPVELIEFDFMTILQENGRMGMNNLLLETARRENPDLIFFCLFTDEIDRKTIGELTERCATFNWFCDDHWRFNNFSKYYAPYFSFISTTDIHALPKYEKIGYRNALLTQWACNHYDYVRMPDIEKDLEVTFVGQSHGNRKRLIRSLLKNGIDVATYGRGWAHGRVSQQEMIEIFNRSNLNLNLAASSRNLHTLFRMKDQIKGRNFEIPGCGGFLLTNYVDGLERYYEIGKEIVCFGSKTDLAEKIKYYLLHEDEREQIAGKGYERTRNDHTYEKRFYEIFSAMGFKL